MQLRFLMKSSRSEPAVEVDETSGRQVLQRLRHEGRKLIEVFVLATDGTVDRYQERTRRRLGSNAVASRTWLCETEAADDQPSTLPMSRHRNHVARLVTLRLSSHPKRSSPQAKPREGTTVLGQLYDRSLVHPSTRNCPVGSFARDR